MNTKNLNVLEKKNKNKKQKPHVNVWRNYKFIILMYFIVF